MTITDLFKTYLPKIQVPSARLPTGDPKWSGPELGDLVEAMVSASEQKENWTEEVQLIWKHAEKQGSSDSAILHSLAWQLFDYSTSPPSGTRPLPRRSSQIGASGEVIVPGIANIECFPNTPLPNHPEGRCKLGHLAHAVKFERPFNGVYCLAGSRGSGKSHALYYLTQACYLYDHNHLPPLTVRWNIGTTFDNREFIIDAIEDVCRTVEYRCETAPYFNAWPCFRPCFFAVARFFELLSLNLRWAIQTLAIIVVAILTIDAWHWFKGQGNENGENSVSEMDLGALLHPNLEFFSIGFVALSIFAIVLRMRRIPWMRDLLPMRCLKPLIASIGLMFLLIASVVTYVLFRREGAIDSSSESDWSWIHILFWSTIVFALVVGLIAPRWWEFYSRCRQLRLQLRNMHAETEAPSLSFLTPLGELIKTLLPSTKDRMAVQDMQWPFLQDFFRLLVADCQSEFGRVVILIDDVDMLPPEKFHDFFRVLRPLTRVPNTCIVIAVPTFLHDVLRLDTTNDLHSTARDVILVGDPKLLNAAGKLREPETSSEYASFCEDRIKPSIESLIDHRCVLPLSGNGGPWTTYIVKRLTQAYQAQVKRTDSKPSQGRNPDPSGLPPTVWEYLFNESISRRETIRLLEQAVRGSELTLFDKQIELHSARIYGDYSLSDIALDPRIERHLECAKAASELEELQLGNQGDDGGKEADHESEEGDATDNKICFLPLRHVYHRQSNCLSLRGARQQLKESQESLVRRFGMRPCRICAMSDEKPKTNER